MAALKLAWSRKKADLATQGATAEEEASAQLAVSALRSRRAALALGRWAACEEEPQQPERGRRGELAQALFLKASSRLDLGPSCVEFRRVGDAGCRAL